MGYDHSDSFPFDFEPNRILFGTKSKGKLSPRSYPILYEREWKSSFLSVGNIQLCLRVKTLGGTMKNIPSMSL